MVESFIEFAPGSVLIYRLEHSPRAESAGATFDGRAIRVRVPSQAMVEWLEGGQVSIAAHTDTGVALLIEKDFQSLNQADEQDPHAWPRPPVS